MLLVAGLSGGLCVLCLDFGLNKIFRDGKEGGGQGSLSSILVGSTVLKLCYP